MIEGRFIPVAGGGGFDALRIRGGRIVETGGAELVERARGEGAALVDHRGKAIIPGIVDPHTHFEHLAIGEIGRIDCRYSECQTVGDVVERLRERQGLSDRDEWIRGYTNLFIDQMLADRRLPTRADLDRVSTERPVVLNCGGHVSVLNSAALARLPESVFAPGAEGFWGAPVIGRDATGAPNGIVAEIDGHLPPLQLTGAEREQAILRRGMDYLISRGVTTIGEMVESRESWDEWEGWIEAGSPVRVARFALWPATGGLDEALELARDAAGGRISDRLRAIGLKVFADGGYSSRNAAILTEYLPEARSRIGDRGRINLSFGQIRALVRRTREAGLRLAIHANGARAQLHVLRAILAEGDAYAHPPVRVEHLGNLLDNDEIVDLVKQANVIPMVQPGFLWSFIGDFLSPIMGDAGRRGRLPLRSLRDEGIVTPFSSDMALGSMDRELRPFQTMADAIHRIGFWGNVIDEHERLSLPEALELHTIEAARALGMDDVIGSLEVGKAADLVVLDVPELASRDLAELAPEAVYVDGVRVFHRDAPERADQPPIDHRK